jgi:hypothetical protein
MGYVGINYSAVNWSTGRFTFALTPDGGVTAPVELMSILKSGNVGIGTTSPSYTLDVEGEVRILNTIGSDPFIVQTPYDRVGKFISTDAGAFLAIQDNSSTNNGVGISVFGDVLTLTTGGAGRVDVSSAGAVKFRNYDSTNQTGTPTYLLGTDASGNIVKTNTVPGSAAGPYLPLAGTSVSGNITGTVVSTSSIQANSFYDGHITWSAAQLNRYGAAIELQYIPTNSSTTIRIGAGGSNPTTFNAYTGEAIFTGNVGIGTTSPSGKLNVNVENAISTVTISRGGSDLTAGTALGNIVFPADYGGTPTTYASIDAYANALSGVRGSLDFKVKSTSGALLTGMTVYGTSSGANVGIGTTSPVSTLQIVATTTEQTTSELTDAGSRKGLLTLSGLSNQVAGAGGGIVFAGNGTTSYAAIKGLLSSGGGNTIGNIAFSTRNATTDTALTERMRISAAGAIQFNAYGVGLLVTDASGNITATSTIPGSDPGPYLALAGGTMTGVLSMGSAGAYSRELKFVNNTYIAGIDFQNSGELRFIDRSGGRESITFNLLNGSIEARNTGNTVTNFISTSGNSYLNGGNVGIGTTAPSQKLHVEGNARITGAYYDSNNSAGTSGQVLSAADAGTDWGWIRNTLTSNFQHTSNSSLAYYFMPFSGDIEITTNQWYNNFTAAYAGRIRKIILKNTNGGTAPTATNTTFKVTKNGTPLYTSGGQTTTAGYNMYAAATLGDSNATFAEGDRLQVSFSANGTWQNAAASIIIEYTEN